MELLHGIGPGVVRPLPYYNVVKGCSQTNRVPQWATAQPTSSLLVFWYLGMVSVCL
jgi:hypothetical protein